MLDTDGRKVGSFSADRYWKSKEHGCPYAEGNRCFIVHEPSPESCKGCRWYEWYVQKQENKNDRT